MQKSQGKKCVVLQKSQGKKCVVLQKSQGKKCVVLQKSQGKDIQKIRENQSNPSNQCIPHKPSHISFNPLRTINRFDLFFEISK